MSLLTDCPNLFLQKKCMCCNLSSVLNTLHSRAKRSVLSVLYSSECLARPRLSKLAVTLAEQLATLRHMDRTYFPATTNCTESAFAYLLSAVCCLRSRYSSLSIWTSCMLQVLMGESPCCFPTLCSMINCL